MMEGEFISDTVYHSYLPANVPRPISHGKFRGNSDTWYYLCEFRDMIDIPPDVDKLVELVAKVHRDSMGKSENGKYGFEVPTHLANVPNDNTWRDTWEEWFTQAMRHMYNLEKKVHGEDEELDRVFEGLCNKVIPRLLRPLETGGHSIKPCLVHSDLWQGNCMTDAKTGELVIFDACAFWGHNEADLGPWRAPRYKLGRPYFEAYKKVMGISEPHADCDDRNKLYAL
jgi:fructosamine-3-kinase